MIGSGVKSRSVSIRLGLSVCALALSGLIASVQAQPRDDTSISASVPSEQAVGVPEAQVDTVVVPTPIRKMGYTVRVWAPTGPAPAKGWPVVYMLDGDSMFEALAGMHASGASQIGSAAVLVGIGYDGDRRANVQARAYDYTPPSPGDDAPTGHPRDLSNARVMPAGGGADRFLDVLNTVIEPVVRQRYAIDTSRRVLYGHSFGGLFALHVYFTQPDAFQAYYAVSPSLWWNSEFILKEAQAFIDQPHHNVGALTIMVGGVELSSSTRAVKAPDLAERLQAVKGLRVNHAVFEGMGHGGVIAPSLAAMLRAPLP